MKKLKLLDVGCGPGTISNMGYYNKLKKEYEIFGIDFLEKNIQNIKKRFKDGHFSVANAEKIPYPSNNFDYIISRHVFEHVEDIGKMISEIKRVSKNGSILRIAVPHPLLEKILNSLLPHYIEEGHHHQRVFDKKTIVSLLEKNDFTVTSYRQKKWLLFIVTIFLGFLSKFTKKISMEEQSGVFSIGGLQYLKKEKLYFLFGSIVFIISLLDILLFFLNYIIPFEIEVTAENNK